MIHDAGSNLILYYFEHFSCPTDAGVFNNANNFGSYRGLPYYMLADEIRMPMFSNSLTHMHCIIKVCLNNEIDQCVVVS